MNMKKKLVLLDGHSILNRAFYGIPLLSVSDGLHTNAVYGFLSILFKILEDERPDYLVTAFDVKAPTFRHELYQAYKGTRKGMPDELHEQVPVMKEVLDAMGVRRIEQPGLEADDLLGALSVLGEQAGMEVTIVSGDRDLLQLATDHVKIHLAKPKKGGSEAEEYYAADVAVKYGVTPKEFIDVKALMGDTSDNIPGLPGVGEKTATKLIAQYHSIEEAYAHLDELKPNKAQNAFREHFDLAKMSKVLATINTGCLTEYSFEEARVGRLYTPEAYELFKKLEFRNFLTRFETEKTADKTAKQSVILLKSEEEADRVYRQLQMLQNKEAASVCVPVIGVSFYQQSLQKGIGLFCIVFGENGYLLDAADFPARAFGRLVYRFLNLPTEELSAETVSGSGNCKDENNTSGHSVKYAVFSVKDLKRALINSGIMKDVSDIDAGQMFDVHLAAYLLNPLKNTYSYDLLASEYMGETVPSSAELLGRVKWDRAYEQNKEALYRILLLEASAAAGLQAPLTEKVREAGMWELYTKMELPLTDTLLRMERCGVRADADSLRVYGQQLGQRIAQLETEIYEDAGGQFNINSPKQLGDILFGKMQLKGGKKTKTGYSTAAEVLERLAPEYPIVAKILEYRQLAKLKSTYADGLAAYIADDRRIHSLFHQTITATGRLSSAEPNLQNIPVRMELGRQIRKVFVPEDGYVFVDADYSQIELRVLAHMSGDGQLIEAYRQNEDIHAITASQVFHVPLDQVTPQMRRNAKAVNFGIVYGISSFGLGQDLGISRKEAEQYIADYFETYPKIKQFLDGLVTSAKENGYAKTLYGRRRPVPELSSSNFMQRSFGERVAMNSPIQGTAADIIKNAMLHVEERLRREQMKSRLILQVHDELLIEAWKPEQTQVEALLREEMEAAAELLVPLIVDVNSGSSWYETK